MGDRYKGRLSDQCTSVRALSKQTQANTGRGTHLTCAYAPCPHLFGQFLLRISKMPAYRHVLFVLQLPPRTQHSTSKLYYPLLEIYMNAMGSALLILMSRVSIISPAVPYDSSHPDSAL